MVQAGETIEWFHELKRSAIEEFLARVRYSALDYLVIDLPPGTGSETFTVLQCLPDIDGLVVVTIPSNLSEEVARRGVNFYQQAGRRIFGVVENMSGFPCPRCGRVVNVFSRGGGELLAKMAGTSLLGRIPLDRRVTAAGDEGLPFILTHPAASVTRAFIAVAERIEALSNQ